MTNQQIVNKVEDAIDGRVPRQVLEKILDHVWDILNDELGVDAQKGVE